MFTVVEKKSGQRIGASVEIIFDTIGGGLADENWAVFITLASYHKFATTEVDRIAIKASEFGNT